jgi:hypothetical protein
MTNKTLSDFFEVYRPKSPDEQKFVDKHVVIKHQDRNGNGDDVFNAKNIKKIDRKKERHGYESGEDEKVYEEVEQVDELSKKTLGSYAKAASDDYGNQANYMGIKGATMARVKRLSKRSEGIHTAIDKLTKEEAELEEAQGSFSRTTPMGKKQKDDWKPASKKPRNDYDRNKRTVKDDELDESSDPYIGNYSYQSKKSGHYVKANSSVHPKGGYLLKWADGSNSHIKNAAEMKNTIARVGLMAEDVALDEKLIGGQRKLDKNKNGKIDAHDFKLLRKEEAVDEAQGSFSRTSPMSNVSKDTVSGGRKPRVNFNRAKRTIKKADLEENFAALDEAVNFKHYTFTTGPKISGSEGSVDHVKVSTTKATKLGVPHGAFIAGNYGQTKTVTVKNNETGAKTHHSVYQSDHSMGVPLFSVRSVGSVRPEHDAHAKALKTYLSGKRTIKEDVEQIDELSKGKLKNYLDKAFDGSRGPATTAAKFRKSVEMGTVAAKKIGQRFPGSKNVKVKVKATNEDVEQIDEISSKVVKNYIKKAWAGRDSGEPDRKGGVGFNHRRKGIDLAYNFALPRNRASDKEAAQAAAKAARRQNELKRQGKVHEDVEQIDEIGNTKAGREGLGSYINKRATDIGARAYEAGKSISWDADEAAYKKELRHRAGIERAVGKLTKPRDKMAEDVEQIDEIGNTKAGRETLARYIVNRTDDIAYNAHNIGRGKLDKNKDFNKSMEREVNHKAGIMNAAVRLAKPRTFRRYYGEELAASFIDKYIPEMSDVPAMTNEERLVALMIEDNISEGIGADILALHSTLDEVNQGHLIDAIEAGDLDEVLDFAIQNRGN